VTDRPEIQRVLRALHADGADSLTLPHIRQQAQTFVDYGHAPYGVLEELVVDPGGPWLSWTLDA
jgi:hypothetical protein